MVKHVKQKEKVKMEELGLFIRTIQIDYKVESDQEMADLISQHFNVICEPEDINHYNQLHEKYNEMIQDDFELDARRHEYFRFINESNPFL